MARQLKHIWETPLLCADAETAQRSNAIRTIVQYIVHYYESFDELLTVTYLRCMVCISAKLLVIHL